MILLPRVLYQRRTVRASTKFSTLLGAALESLIEPALGEAPGVQGHRQEHVELGQRPGREASGEEPRERELSAILERLHEPVAWKFVAPQCERGVEVRGTVEASPAHRRGGTGKGAPGARFGEHGQFADASRAERLGPGSH